MGFKVILTPQSLVDLEQIVRFIAKHDSVRAHEFGNELIDRAVSLSDFPERGRLVPEIGEESVRELLHGSYRIIFEVYRETRSVYVLRFWHAARGEPDVRR